MSAWRFAFSTLGIPGVSVADAVRLALENDGCDGLELRVNPDEEVSLDLPAARRAGVRAQLADAGLDLPCIAGYVKICSPADGIAKDLDRLLELASDLGAGAVRVFPGGTGGRPPERQGPGGRPPEGPGAEADGDGMDERAHGRLDAVAGRLVASGVRVLVETHDSHPTGTDVARLVRPFRDVRLADGSPAIAAIWDVLHPWRHGEAPADTLAALDGHLGYVQIKDAADLHPVPMGTGAVPLEECGELLGRSGWTGWVSLEWEKAWYPEAAPLETVLPGAIAWTRRHEPRDTADAHPDHG